MSFISANNSRIVPGYGPKDSRIVLIGEAPGAEEAKQLRPFVGPAGTVLEQCLHAAGLARSDCYMTNVVKVRPPNNNIGPYYSETKHQFTDAGREWVQALHEEMDELQPNVIVTLGAVAAHAMLGRRVGMIDTKAHPAERGYVCEGYNGYKVIPAIHPAASLRGQYILRYVISSDLKKAKEQATFPEIIRPHRNLIYHYDNMDECIAWIRECGEADRLSVDIEVLNYELAIVGLAPSPELGIAIPMADSYWNDYDEVILWREVAKVLGNHSTKIFQNGIFDIHFLAARCGIKVNGPILDTMIAHHLMYPDMRKGLNFLGSLYCGSQEFWKNLIKFDNIKDES